MVHRRPPWRLSILSLLERSFNFQKTDLTRICSLTTYWSSGRCKCRCILLKKNPLNLLQRIIYANIETAATWLALRIYSDVSYTINSEVSQRDAMELAVMIFTHNIIAADICHQPFSLVHPQLCRIFPPSCRRGRFRDTSICGAPRWWTTNVSRSNSEVCKFM